MFGTKQQPLLTRHQQAQALGETARRTPPEPLPVPPADAPRALNPAPMSPAMTTPTLPPQNAATPAAQPLATPASQAGNSLIVGPDVKLKGAEILDCDTLVVEGRVEATMDSRVIRITERGAFSGKVEIDIAEIHGTFEGELTARQQLTIHATGRVTGQIRYGKLLIEAGGMVSGDVSHISENRASAAHSTEHERARKMAVVQAASA